MCSREGGNQFNLRARELNVRGQGVEILDAGSLHRFLHRGVVHQDVVDRRLHAVVIDAHAAGRIPLRVQIDQQNAKPLGGDAGGQIDCGRRLPHAAFLVCNTDHFRQKRPAFLPLQELVHKGHEPIIADFDGKEKGDGSIPDEDFQNPAQKLPDQRKIANGNGRTMLYYSTSW